MKRCSVIIQGEGKGHFSQALSVCSMLGKQQTVIQRVYLGRSLFSSRPDYFSEALQRPFVTFLSPGFIHSSTEKGIRVFPSLLVNLLLGPVYLFEAVRIGICLMRDRSGLVYNFYDPVGALAARWMKRRAVKVVVSHHFYLSHPDFLHPHGMEGSNFWLQLLNRFMMRSADRVLALSFREGRTVGKMEVVPPLIREQIRTMDYRPGSRDLCYFLYPGYVTEMIAYGREHPGEQADIFTGRIPEEDIPANVTVQLPSGEQFAAAMQGCRRIITTAGFDTVAEAFWLGIPVFLLPSENHYEQYCNALDAARTGLAFPLENLSDLSDTDFVPVENSRYRKWAGEGWERGLLFDTDRTR